MSPISRCQSLPVSHLAATLLQQHATCLVTTSMPMTGSATSACPLMNAWPPRREWCGSCTSGSSGSSSAMAAPQLLSTPALTFQTLRLLELLWRCHVPSLCPRPLVKSHRQSPPPSNPCPPAGHTPRQTDGQSGPWMKWHLGTAQDPVPLDIFVPIFLRYNTYVGMRGISDIFSIVGSWGALVAWLLKHIQYTSLYPVWSYHFLSLTLTISSLHHYCDLYNKGKRLNKSYPSEMFPRS